ncbi:hypothetical protein BDV25DRAFT_113166 [Aspergillus avenaceus]|uniref:Uncharacterized protein n=1 Tax=Aspergillus avenaceus TaxID=36643 RepID=A0A5N6TVA7_ASPAV|nr:hypothetical protein BDV25DRAFT_113166 [Aspergillus avenaceus]
MAGGKADVTEIGDVPSGAKPSFKARAATHFKRWWWAYLIGFIVVVLVVVLPVVYVGYPNIAQSDIDDSTLEIKSMDISDPAPDSFKLNQKQAIGSDSAFHPVIYDFDADVSLLGAAVFATVQVPQVKSRDGAEVIVDQRVGLKDVSAFGEFAKAVMLNEDIELNIYGKPNLKQGSLPKITVTYNKTVSMKGLNKLKGFKLLNMHLDSSENGTNSAGEVLIPNPSVMTIALGNVTLGLSANGTSVGESYIKNLVLKPGDNRLPMRANVNQLSIVNMMKKYGTIVPLNVTGSPTNSSIYDGQSLPYFSQALAANALTVQLNITEVLGS